jgi:hypothetical protein
MGLGEIRGLVTVGIVGKRQIPIHSRFLCVKRSRILSFPIYVLQSSEQKS